MAEQNFFAGDYSGAGECYFGHHKPTEFNNQFIIDDLLVDFPNNDDVVLNDAFFDNVIGNSTDSSTVTAVDSCNSSVSGSEAPFSSSGNVSRFSESRFSGVEMCLPYDDLGELEWLSNLTHDQSFSTADEFPFQFRDSKFISAPVIETPATATSSSHTTSPEFRSQPLVTTRTNSQIFQTEVFVPGKSRSKRSRIAPCNWTSRIRHLKSSSASKTAIKTHKPTSFFQVLEPSEGTSFKKQRRGEKVLEPSDDVKRQKATSFKQRRRGEKVLEPSETIRCLHCGSDTTPQWRSGPMGPKTLCNACGVRYKSGRLVPEYRPAASPTYVSAKHSNSHRKVMEIRRQKELRNVNRESVDRGSVLDGSDGGGCLMDRQSGPGFYKGVWN